MTRAFPVNISLSAAACIGGCLLILLAPLHLVFSFYIAATIHEFFHILMLQRFHVPIYSISIGINGAAIHSAPLAPREEFLCAAAGPLGSFICLLLLRAAPTIALCGLIQGIYNLLPVYPMDGGRMIRCLCQRYCPHRSDSICRAAAVITVLLLCSFCIYLYLRSSDYLYCVIALYFLFQTCLKRKIPCKEHRY